MSRLVNSAGDFESTGLETWQLVDKIARAIGVRRVARAVGRHERTIYFWMHDPLTADGPDGHTNLLDWNEALVAEIASVPRARGELLELEHWFIRLFDRAIRKQDPDAICDMELLRRCAKAAKEHGQAMSELLDLSGDEAVALREALEARHAIDEIILGLESRAAR